MYNYTNRLDFVLSRKYDGVTILNILEFVAN